MNTASFSHRFSVAPWTLKSWTHWNLSWDWTSDFFLPLNKTTWRLTSWVKANLLILCFPNQSRLKCSAQICRHQGCSRCWALQMATKWQWQPVSTVLDLAVPLQRDHFFCWAVSMTSSHKEDLVRCIWTGTLYPVAVSWQCSSLVTSCPKAWRAIC